MTQTLTFLPACREKLVMPKEFKMGMDEMPTGVKAIGILC